MKKFVVFFLLCICLFCSALYKQDFNFCEYQNLSIQVFTGSKCDKRHDDIIYIENGSGQILLCDYNTYQYVCKNVNDISGVAFIFDGDAKIFDSVIKKLMVSLTEKTSNSFVGYTNFFSKSVTSAGKKVNVQGYYNNGRIYIGTPLLLGCY